MEPIPEVSLRKALAWLGLDRARAVGAWLDRGGPFWDGEHRHSADDWFECRGEVVTDTAVGEAAWRNGEGRKCGLLSATPGDWDFSPVRVLWKQKEAGLDRPICFPNWRDPATLEEGLRKSAPPLASWAGLRKAVSAQCPRLFVADSCFDPLAGVPFSRSSAKRVLHLLRILDDFADSFDRDGQRTEKGHGIYQEHFTGERALFSDSTEAEKRRFRRNLRFPHPEQPGEMLSCPWHGKERHSLIRVHFSWPIRAGEPVYVVYAGRKLTRR